MNIIEEPLKGCHLLEARRFEDHRGDFVKTFHHGIYSQAGLATDWKEEFYSTSKRGVLRGMHFQLPPHDHDKMVYCIQGKVLDVVLDLRKGFRFGATAALELSAANHRILLIPKGVAHGFFALEENSMMVYKTSTVHVPEADAGILWSSINISWPGADPIVSARDAAFPRLADFSTPF